MTDQSTQPIVIRKVVKGDGHHGGSWKVAFADFATAMMAFFLLMWLIGSASEEQKGAISEYFQNPSRVVGDSDIPLTGGATGSGDPFDAALITEPVDVVPEETARQIADAAERRRLESLLEELKQAIEQSQALKPFKDQLLLDIMPEGLRIQIVDKENRPMFEVGSDALQDYTTAILAEISQTINEVPNRISITGHTDARPYTLRRDYSNWELSSDRANAARRALVGAGMQSDKIGRIVGLGDSVMFVKDDPLAAVNRRISIIVMNRATEDAIRDGVAEGGGGGGGGGDDEEGATNAANAAASIDPGRATDERARANPGADPDPGAVIGG